MSPEVAAKVKAFVKERDEMLLACDVDRMLAFHAKHNPNVPAPASRELAETAIHKARTAITNFPMEERLKSKRWLRERGFTSMDDGNLHDG